MRWAPSAFFVFGALVRICFSDICLIFDLYPLERISASYQRDLRPIVLENGWKVGISVLSFRTFELPGI